MTVGAVVIGRNEAARLDGVLAVLGDLGDAVVYVDSASGDASVTIARRAGVHVVEISSGALSAARARNEGVAALVAVRPDVDVVQFVDGDCVLADGWIEAARAELDATPSLGAVCGWTVEARPRANLFHRIADAEWHQGAVGDDDSFAGIVMIRRQALERAGGYDPALVAGEDTELAARIRDAGFGVRRIDVVAAEHDIAMATWSQWWRRSKRAGYCFASIGSARRHVDGLFLRQYRRTVLWGLIGPAVAAAAWRVSKLPALLLVVRSALTFVRVARRPSHPGADRRDRLAWAFNCVAAVYPASFGVARWWRERATGGTARLIDHRKPPVEPTASGGGS